MPLIYFLIKFVTDYGKGFCILYVKNKITTFCEHPYFDSKHHYINSNVNTAYLFFNKSVTEYGKGFGNFHVKK